MDEKLLYSGDLPMSLGFLTRVDETTDIEKLKKEASELELLLKDLKDSTSMDETKRRIKYLQWRIEILNAGKSDSVKK